MGSPEERFHFAIDRGGTFTDVFAQCPGGHVRVLKLLSEDPANYADAPTEGIRRILEQEGGVPLPRDRPLDTSRIASIRMGTTVATNALLERRGERVALLVTRGFRDLLHVGTQAREDLFDLAVPMPEVLYEEVVEVEERVVLHRGEPGAGPPVKGRTGDLLEVQRPVDLGDLRGKLEGLLSRGIRSLAVVLMHAYTSQIGTERFLHLRYQGTDCALMVSAQQHPATARSPRAGDFGAAFTERYMREFGFVIPERPVVVDDVRVRGTGRSGLRLEDACKAQTGPPRVDKVTQCYFEGGYQETPVYLLGELGCGHKLQGPCLIIDSNSTILVEPGCQAEVTETGDIRISVGAEAANTVGAQLDPIHLSIFSHRFMSIAAMSPRRGPPSLAGAWRRAGTCADSSPLETSASSRRASGKAEAAHVVQHRAQDGPQAAHQAAGRAQVEYLLQTDEVQARRQRGSPLPGPRCIRPAPAASGVQSPSPGALAGTGAVEEPSAHGRPAHGAARPPRAAPGQRPRAVQAPQWGQWLWKL
ncbi:PREDICTED: 5-oxoprolinase [Condylura cristata]|uniref:5-oxoprolinase n=1 Tax=Condylura cristata TaxID=143302 RepID=UPI0006435AD4|nr:PREDICTED: 5-oxoprolinase [Condylura cristata]